MPSASSARQLPMQQIVLNVRIAMSLPLIDLPMALLLSPSTAPSSCIWFRRTKDNTRTDCVQGRVE